MNRPLCPHCLREACPWLLANTAQAPVPPPSTACPLAREPLAPGPRALVLAALAREGLA